MLSSFAQLLIVGLDLGSASVPVVVLVPASCAGRSNHLEARPCGPRPDTRALLAPYPARSTVQTEAQIGPPMLNVAAARGLGTCSSAGTLPRSCHATHPTIATPVEPIGCPLAMSPPEVLIPH